MLFSFILGLRCLAKWEGRKKYPPALFSRERRKRH
jgi:hypothetical protein